MADVVFGDFEWDSAKAAANARKHGVTFEEATTAFDDPNAIDAPDFEDSSRFVLIGFSHQTPAFRRERRTRFTCPHHQRAQGDADSEKGV